MDIPRCHQKQIHYLTQTKAPKPLMPGETLQEPSCLAVGVNLLRWVEVTRKSCSLTALVQVGLVTLRIRIGPSASVDADIGIKVVTCGYQIMWTFIYILLEVRLRNATSQSDNQRIFRQSGIWPPT